MHQVGEVEHPAYVVDVRVLDLEGGDQLVAQAWVHAVVDLDADDLAEAPAAKLGLDRLEQVVGLVRHLEVSVARDAEDAAIDDLHAREQGVEVVRDDLFERHEDVLVDRTSTKRGSSSFGTSRARTTRAGRCRARARARRGSATGSRCTGTGAPAPTASGVSTGKIWRWKRSASVARWSVGQLVDGDDADAVLSERRQQIGLDASEQPLLLQDHVAADRFDRLGRRAAVGERVADARVDLVESARRRGS